MLTKVISGGQTGADEAGLVTARLYGLETGGWMPANCITQDGNKSHFKELYGMQEHTEFGYKPRTFANVRDSNGTVRFANNFKSPGEICTLNAIRYYQKPFYDVYIDGSQEMMITQFIKWLTDNNIFVLNVAGNSRKSCPIAFDFVCEYLTRTFEQLGLERSNESFDT